MSAISKSHSVFYVKRPGSGRASFCIAKRTVNTDGSRSQENYKNELIDAINLSPVSQADKDLQISRICAELNAAQKTLERGVYIASEANLKLLATYWDAEYSDRKIKRLQEAKDRFKWAIDNIGLTSLLADRKELQRVVDDKCKSAPRKQRKLCSVLNQIRKYFGVRERLRLERKVRPKFKYLTEQDFRSVLRHVDPPYCDLFQVLFYTGVRTGEAFALQNHHHRQGTLKVLTQIDRDQEEVGTKSGRIRSTILMDNGLEAFDRWADAPGKAEICRNGLSRILKRACVKAFPLDPSKHVTPHGLRHSFAVMCLTKYDISISMIAQLLGNSVVVCEEYYLSFVLGDETLQLVLTKTRKAQTPRPA